MHAARASSTPASVRGGGAVLLLLLYHQPHGSIMAKPSATLTLLALAGIAAAAAAAGGEDTKVLNMNKIGGYSHKDEDGEEPFEFEITAAKFSSKVCGLSYPVLSCPIRVSHPPSSSLPSYLQTTYRYSTTGTTTKRDLLILVHSSG